MKSMCIAQTIVAPLAGAWIEIVVEPTTPGSTITVAPLAGAWIEICIFDGDNNPYSVAPLAGAWIEIENGGIEHGKSKVAPLAGAWIEIQKLAKFCTIYWVAPLAGAWIEIFIVIIILPPLLSLPSRERGLKYVAICVSLAGVGRSPRGSVD